MLHYKFEPFCYDGLHSTHCTMNDERSFFQMAFHCAVRNM